SKTKGNNSGWIVITFGWGMAVFVGVFCVAKFSGAHLNPAVTIALAAAGKFDSQFEGWNCVAPYIIAQMLGAFIGAVLVYIVYRDHFDATDDANAKLAVFCTGPNIRSLPSNFISEAIGTFALVLPIFLMVGPSLVFSVPVAAAPATPQISAAWPQASVGLGALGALPVGLLVFAIGLSLGGTTGYAVNP